MSQTSSAHWCGNGFYDAKELCSLYEMVPRRSSCRLFRSGPSAQQVQALTQAAQALALPGVRLAVSRCHTSLFQPWGGLLMKFENVQCCVAVIAGPGPQSAVNAGVSGEMLLLKAVQLDMAGVWVSGTFKRRAVPVKLEAEERLLALIALGVPPEGFSVGQRSRKPLASLLDGPENPGDALLMEIARAVQAAPSAMNRQPWRLRRADDGSILLSVRHTLERLDLGIAAAHLMLALGKEPRALSLAPDGLSIRVAPGL